MSVSLYREAKEQKRKLITTNYVLTEVVTVSTSPLRIPRKDIIAFIAGLKNSPLVEIVHIDPRLDEKAWQLLQKGWTKIGAWLIAPVSLLCKSVQ